MRVGSPPSNTLINSLNEDSRGKISVSALEKHLDDYQKGRGNLSRETGAAIGVREDVAYRNLQGSDISALSKFGAYTTAFTYSEKARFVDNISDISDSIAELRKAFDVVA